MAQARLNSSELARQINLPAATIKRIRNNEQANPTVTTLLPIAKYFSITLSQLVGDVPALSNVMTKQIVGLREIPLFSLSQCKDLQGINYEMHEPKVLTELQLSEMSFAVAVKEGDLTSLPNDCIAIVEPATLPQHGDYILSSNIEKSTVAITKYIVEIDQIYLKSSSTWQNAIPFTDAYTVIGVIVQYKKDLKL